MNTDKTIGTQDTFTRLDLVNLLYGGLDDVFVATSVNGVFPTERATAQNLETATHLVTARLGAQLNASGNPFRSGTNILSCPILQMDDIGSKSIKTPPLAPTVNMQTKPSNSTYIYKFTRELSKDEYLVISHSLIAAGYGDANCGDAERLFRLQGSLPEGKVHAAQILSVKPDAVYDPDTFLADMKVEQIALDSIGSAGGDPLPAPAGVVVVDEVFDWLDAQGMVVAEDTGGWFKIICPWAHTHSSTSEGQNQAKYRPATEVCVRRLYHCHHGHGGTDGIEELLDWVFAAGGPDCGRSFPIERNVAMLFDAGVKGGGRIATAVVQKQEKQEQSMSASDEIMGRYVWHSPTGKAFDLQGPPEFPEFVMAGLKGKWLPKAPRDEKDKPMCLINSWIASDKMETAMRPALDPRKPVGYSDGFVNTYRPFVPLDVTGGGDEFLALVKHVYPNDWEYALDWMANKVQHPEARMVALVSYTPTGGTGRNSVMNILSQVLGEGNCTSISADRLFGAKANQFNAYMTNLLVTVGEVAEAAEGDNVRITGAAYNRLKELVDPNEGKMQIEGKGVDGANRDIFTSFMIATNAATFPIEQGDRRFTVTRGNNKPLDRGLVPWLKAIKDAQDPVCLSEVFHMLALRDVSMFDASTPKETDAKQFMINERKTDIDHAIDDILEGVDVFTVKLLVDRVMGNAMMQGNGRLDATLVGRQVKGWARHNSSPLPWVADPRSRLKVEGAMHFPRCLNGGLDAGETSHREALNQWLGLKDTHGAIPFKRPE